MKPNQTQTISKLILLFIFATLFTLATVSIIQNKTTPIANAESETTKPELSQHLSTESELANCRYGTWGSQSAWIPTLGAGWYVEAAPNKRPALSNNAELVHIIRFNKNYGQWYDVYPPLNDDPEGLGPFLDANPGHLWLIGSEMESERPVSGDDLLPAEYADEYHEVYNYIKQRDPSALIGTGAVSSATPARIQYMELAFDAYMSNYGVPMPIDVWNTHLYVFSEIRPWDGGNADGRIALGTDPDIAKEAPWTTRDPFEIECPKDKVYCRSEHDDVSIFGDQIVDLRTWMRDHGYQDIPLIISEMSILYQPQVIDEFGGSFTPARIEAYMDTAFNYLETATDPNIGFPQDNNRLVQQWMWFSLAVPEGGSGYGSNLLRDDYLNFASGDVNALDQVGVNFRNEVLARPTSVNLKAGTAADVTGVTDGSGTGGVLLEAKFYNNGNINIEQPFDVSFYADANLTQLIGSTTVDPLVRGCAKPHDAAMPWNNLPPGTYTYWVKVDALNQIAENDESTGDNVSTGTVVIDPAVDAEAPVVDWQAPVTNGNSYVVGTTNIQLKMNATDNMGVTAVKLTRWDPIAAQQVLLGWDYLAPYQMSFNPADLLDGWNQVTATAYDSAGNAASQHIWLVKGNGAPTPTATSSGPGDTPTPTSTPVETSTPIPSPTPNYTPTPLPDNDPALIIAQNIPTYGVYAHVPIQFNSNNRNIKSATFAIDFDESCLDYDSLSWANSTDFDVTAVYDGANTSAELMLSIESATPGVFLTNGKLATLTFSPTCQPPDSSPLIAAVSFAAAPVPIMVDDNDLNNNVMVTDGSVWITGMSELQLLPVIRK